MRVIPLVSVAIALLLSAAPHATANFDLSKCYGAQVENPAQPSTVEVCPPQH